MNSGKDSLAFELLKKQTIKQKLDYIYYNPVMEDGNYAKPTFMKKGLIILSL